VFVNEEVSKVILDKCSETTKALGIGLASLLSLVTMVCVAQLVLWQTLIVRFDGILGACYMVLILVEVAVAAMSCVSALPAPSAGGAAVLCVVALVADSVLTVFLLSREL